MLSTITANDGWSLASFESEEVEKEVCDSIPKLPDRFIDNARVGMAFQLSSTGNKDLMGMLGGLADGGLNKIVRSYLGDIDRKQPDFTLWDQPFGYGDRVFGKDKPFEARLHCINKGFTSTASPYRIKDAGWMLSSTDIPYYAYIGTARNSAGLKALYAAYLEDETARITLDMAIKSCVGPLVDAGFGIVMDAAGEVREDGIETYIAKWLGKRGALAGYEPRAVNDGVWRKLASEGKAVPCFCELKFTTGGVPRGLLRSDPDLYPNDDNTQHMGRLSETASEAVVWPKPGSAHAFTTRVAATLLARGYSVMIGPSDPVTAPELKDMAARIREGEG